MPGCAVGGGSCATPNAAVAYLNRAVANGGRDRLRHRRRRDRRSPARTVPLAPRGLASAEHEALGHDEAGRLWGAPTHLPPRQRQVLVLRYYLDQSEAEIADTLQVSCGSVKKHASRGLDRPRRRLEAGS